MLMLIDFDIVTVIIGIVIYAIWCVYIYRKKKPVKTYYIFTTVVFVYIMAVIKLTLFPIVMIGLPANIAKNINLIPFKTGIGRTEILNIIMTIPFGIGLPFVSKLRTLKKVTIAGALFSCMIEALQLFEAVFTHGFIFRVIDINDVICNTAGAVIGFLLLYAFSNLFKARQEVPQDGIKNYLEYVLIKVNRGER